MGSVSVRDRRDFDRIALIAEIVSPKSRRTDPPVLVPLAELSFNDDFGMRAGTSTSEVSHLVSASGLPSRLPAMATLSSVGELTMEAKQENRMNSQADRDIERAIVFFQPWRRSARSADSPNGCLVAAVLHLEPM